MLNVYSAAMVKLYPPTNITLFLRQPREVVIAWAPPDVYTYHDVNTTLIDPPFGNTSVPENTTPSPANNRNTTQPPGSSNVTVNPKPANTSDSPPTTPTAIDSECRSLEYFENYTVGFNDTEEALNFSLPQLFSLHDVYQAENITSGIQEGAIVVFSQGCVLEYQVVYFPTNQSGKSVCCLTLSLLASSFPCGLWLLTFCIG
jgi:hypothetical protein